MKEDIVICPGCAKVLPKRNNGCKCGYENADGEYTNESAPFRIPPLKELLTSKQLFDDVCPAFLMLVAKWGWQYGQTVHKEAGEQMKAKRGRR